MAGQQDTRATHDRTVTDLTQRLREWLAQQPEIVGIGEAPTEPGLRSVVTLAKDEAGQFSLVFMVQ
jgi:hypothetical protein